jgi:vanillate O-demethylase monooxygenase subunit
MRLKEMIGYAFKMEDEPMIEQVHANMGGSDFWSLRPIILAGDAAGVRARRILSKKIRHENGTDESED